MSEEIRAWWRARLIRLAANGARDENNHLYAKCKFCHAVGETPEDIHHTSECQITKTIELEKFIFK